MKDLDNIARVKAQYCTFKSIPPPMAKICKIRVTANVLKL